MASCPLLSSSFASIVRVHTSSACLLVQLTGLVAVGKFLLKEKSRSVQMVKTHLVSPHMCRVTAVAALWPNGEQEDLRHREIPGSGVVASSKNTGRDSGSQVGAVTWEHHAGRVVNKLKTVCRHTRPLLRRGCLHGRVCFHQRAVASSRGVQREAESSGPCNAPGDGEPRLWLEAASATSRPAVGDTRADVNRGPNDYEAELTAGPPCAAAKVHEADARNVDRAGVASGATAAQPGNARPETAETVAQETGNRRGTAPADPAPDGLDRGCRSPSDGPLRQFAGGG